MFSLRNVVDRFRNQRRKSQPQRRLLLESLETRAVPAVFAVTTIDDAGAGSLRQAIINANASPGKDSIDFNIPGPGVKTITLQSALPAISEALDIDGFTQSDLGTLPSVEITAGNESIPWGLTVTAGDSLFRKLAISGFSEGSVQILGGDNNRIQYSYLGTSALGNDIPQRGQVASVYIGPGSEGNQIGVTVNSPNTAQGNLIVGGERGVLIEGAGARYNSVSGNTIGLIGAGLGNGLGVLVSGGAFGNAIRGNFIRGNEDAGVSIQGTNSTGNRIQGNIVHDNGGLEIDLGGNGATKNDFLDRDVGPNQLANRPVIQSVIDLGDRLAVTGALHSVPNQTFTIEIYASREADTAGLGQAERAVSGLATITVTTDADGLATFSQVRPITLPEGWVVSATATNQFGNSSEFSQAVAINGRSNEPAIVSQGNTPVTYTATLPPVLVAPVGRVVELDSKNYQGGWFSVKVLANATADDRLAIRNEGTGAGQIGISGNQVTFGGVVIGTFSGGSGNTSLSVSLNKNATPLAVQALMRNITFESLGATPSTARRTLQFQLGDGQGNVTNAFGAVNVALPA